MSEYAIELSGVVNRFAAKTVHDGLALSVRNGEVLTIIGASGGGKTVLLNCMMGLRVPDEGEIRILGRTLEGTSRQRTVGMRNRVGVLFQKGALFTALTVAENVGFPIRELHSVPERVVRRLVNFKLQLVGLDVSDGSKLPAELSGGMIKRAALARALALDPELLFLDEPTTGLDPLSARAFVELLGGMHRSLGLTVVMVSHDLNTLTAVSDRVAVLADKKVIAVDGVERLSQMDHPFIQEFFKVYRERGPQFR